MLELVNEPTRVTIRKLAIGSDGATRLGPLSGAALRIETEDGQEVCRFTTDASGSREFKGILEAGASRRPDMKQPRRFSLRFRKMGRVLRF